jgi:hypothetical protein
LAADAAGAAEAATADAAFFALCFFTVADAEADAEAAGAEATAEAEAEAAGAAANAEAANREATRAAMILDIVFPFRVRTHDSDESEQLTLSFPWRLTCS